ncbi:MAG: hypothetical protein ACE5GA_05880, partial [Candidatus Zixiibacteriota bacterium]
MRTFVGQETAERIIRFYYDRFGLPEDVFAGCAFVQGSRQRVYLVKHDLLETSAEVVSGINVCRIGAAIKPTTDFLQLHSRRLSVNTVELNAKRARQFIRGDDLELTDIESQHLTDGYICPTYNSFALGC